MRKRAEEEEEEEAKSGAAATVGGFSEFLLKGSTAWREAPLCPDYVGPIVVSRTPDGRGRGLFATEDVRAGTLLLISNPMAISYDDPHRILLLAKLIASAQKDPHFLCKIYSLAHAQSSQNHMAVPSMDFLTSKSSYDVSHEEAAPPVNPARIMDIVMLNSFEGEFTNADQDSSKTSFCGLWLIPSLINHSCHRNASRLIVGGAMILHAAADICKGEEVTITYVDTLAPLALRQKASLAMKFGFSCNCKRCIVEKSLECSLHDVSNKFSDLHDKASEEVHNAIFSQGSPPLISSFTASTELRDVFDAAHERIWTHNELSDLEKKWVLAGYSSAYLGKWLVNGYTTRFANMPALMDQKVMGVVEALRGTVPGLAHTLSLITFLVSIAQRLEGKDVVAKKLFKLGLDECSRVYGNQKLDVIVKLMEKSTEVIPFF